MKTNNRKNELAQIHIAKAQLGMADDTYRSLLLAIGRVDSSAKLDDAGRRALLDHFKLAGWTPKAAVKKVKKSVLAKTPRGRLLLVLWGKLHAAGKVEDPSDSALERYVLNHTKLDRLEWLKGDHLNLMVEQLKGWLAR
jgi:phage gp16-like protein